VLHSLCPLCLPDGGAFLTGQRGKVPRIQVWNADTLETLAVLKVKPPVIITIIIINIIIIIIIITLVPVVIVIHVAQVIAFKNAIIGHEPSQPSSAIPSASGFPVIYDWVRVRGVQGFHRRAVTSLKFSHQGKLLVSALPLDPIF
jgi:hypothetical protein